MLFTLLHNFTTLLCCVKRSLPANTMWSLGHASSLFSSLANSAKLDVPKSLRGIAVFAPATLSLYFFGVSTKSSLMVKARIFLFICHYLFIRIFFVNIWQFVFLLLSMLRNCCVHRLEDEKTLLF